jgi:hypothetical protein
MNFSCLMVKDKEVCQQLEINFLLTDFGFDTPSTHSLFNDN